MNKEEIIDKIKLLTVKIKTANENGTWVLFLNNNKAYIFTAYHCIHGKKEPYHSPKNSDIEIIFNQKTTYSINPIKIESYKKNISYLEVDINSIEINELEYSISDEIPHDIEFFLRGYPKGVSEAHPFIAKCNENIDNERFRIIVDDLTSDTSGDDAIDFVRGLSGSGVFFNNGNELCLIGLADSLASQSGIFNAVNCVKVLFFHKILNSNDKETVSVDFGEYSVDVFKNPVAFKEFDIFCSKNSREKPIFYGSKRGVCPVVNVSLNDATLYCAWLSKKNNKKYRLLTSIEWDYIAEKNRIPKHELDKYIHHNGNSDNIQPIESKKHGELGIYDMYGNTDEWCKDGIIKGGSIKYTLDDIINNDFKDKPPEDTKHSTLGFRILIEN